MNRDSFDRFVDGYIENVLDVVERLEQQEPVSAEELHQSLVGQLRDGRRVVHDQEDWEAAAYALAAWTDELMLDLPWQGRSWWNDHPLETNLFGTRLCSERFFELAKAAARDRSDSVLRVFHDCVLLGFRGLYSIPGQNTSITNHLGIPPTLQQWIVEVQQRLADDSAGRGPAKRLRSLPGAAPLEQRRSIVWWTVASCTMIAINVTIYSLLIRS